MTTKVDINSATGKWLMRLRDILIRELSQLEAKKEEIRERIHDIDKQIR